MEPDFHARLAPYLDAFAGSFAFYAQRLSDGATLEHEADALMPPASAIKLAIMVAAYRCAEVHAIDLGQRVDLPAGTPRRVPAYCGTCATGPPSPCVTTCG